MNDPVRKLVTAQVPGMTKVLEGDGRAYVGHERDIDISVPDELRLATEDGRIIRVTEWHPHIAVDDAVRVTVVGVLYRPKKAPET